MRAAVCALLTLELVLVGGCGSGASTSSVQEATTPAASASGSLSADSDVLGTWHRAQSCQEMLAAFERAGLAESHVDWLTGNFYGGGAAPTAGDVCAGARGPLEHSHFFTSSGGFGSKDEHGQQVDGGDHVIVDAETLAFPSHATEFHYAGDLVVDYSIAGDVVTFEVVLPQPCEGTCKDAYAWALSAFASGPWARGDVP